ncbi:MAG: Gfo/Idh/MocA family oxidoreductase [Anaerolineaceae bacterium]|nr:Gfo/Idh/MocA family oxidoreductase [Anaerolineaceae bacterium]
MKTQPMKLAVVGCRGMGSGIARVAAAHPQITLNAVCDINETYAQDLLGSLSSSAAVYTDYATMLGDADLDAVYLGTPHHLHFDMVRAAVARGLPVLCEKPITEHIDSAIELVQLVKPSGVKVGINYQNRYEIHYHTLIRAARQGHLGKIRWGRINVPWEREWDYFADSPWHTSKARAGGGTLLTQGSHYIDIVLEALRPAFPVEAVGVADRLKFGNRIEVEDFAMGILRMSDGTFIEVCSSMNAHPQQPVVIELYGEHGTAIVTDKTKIEFRGCDDFSLTDAGLPGENAVEISLEGFRRWVMDGTHDFLIPIESALPALACVDAIYDSAEARAWQVVKRG